MTLNLDPAGLLLGRNDRPGICRTSTSFGVISIDNLTIRWFLRPLCYQDNHNPRGLHTVLNQLLENCSAWEGRQPGHPGPIRFPGKSASA